MEEERDEKEWNGKEEMKRDLRDERPSKTPDPSEAIPLESKLKNEGKE